MSDDMTTEHNDGADDRRGREAAENAAISGAVGAARRTSSTG